MNLLQVLYKPSSRTSFMTTLQKIGFCVHTEQFLNPKGLLCSVWHVKDLIPFRFYWHGIQNSSLANRKYQKVSSFSDPLPKKRQIMKQFLKRDYPMGRMESTCPWKKHGNWNTVSAFGYKPQSLPQLLADQMADISLGYSQGGFHLRAGWREIQIITYPLCAG